MSISQPVEIFGKNLGVDQPSLIVAEVGFNHNGDLELARQMIRSAKEHGADAVKLQTFQAGEFYSRTFEANDPDAPDRRIPFYEFFERYELQARDYEILFRYAQDLGIPLFSTPFDENSLDLLVDLGMPAIKIASGDLTHHRFLHYAAGKQLPMVVSTGMADWGEVGAALEVIQKGGNPPVVLLHCVSNYPARSEEMNLACLPELQRRFEVPIGLSDHTPDALSATVACSLGAVMIEKHFTTDRKLPGADQSMSIEPHELQQLKEIAVNVHRALGDGEKKPQDSELGTRTGARRSVVAHREIPRGTVITADMLIAKRPGTGIPAEDLSRVIGRTARTPIPAEEILTWDMV